MDCSVIISTRNRAEALEQTLRSLGRLEVPLGLQVELLLVDNGSSDLTSEVIRTAQVPGMVVRHFHEARPGKSRALNLAVGQAKGDVLLFTDDDVEPAANWIEKMARPLLERKCDAVAGRIVLGEELRRPWLTPYHAVFLAETAPVGDSPDLIGASMGLRKEVFGIVGFYDENLGPGASGFGEESLMCRQMRTAGLRIMGVTDTDVVHHPEADRLLRKSWLAAAEKIGRSNAYILHHWEHERICFPRLRFWWLLMKLALRNLVQRDDGPESEGCPIWEMSYRIRLALLRQYLQERGKLRNYERYGLRTIVRR